MFLVEISTPCGTDSLWDNLTMIDCRTCSVQCTNEYSNIFLRILIFVFDSWQFSKPNIIRIFEYFCTNISEYWSLKITWNTWIKEFYFPFLTWRYILTTLLITMIISCWSVNPLNTGHLCKAELCMLFRKIFHLCITNYSKIFEYSNVLNYSNIIRIYFTARIIFAIRFGQFG